MKKFVPMTLALLALTATMASAQSINLGWGACRSAANTANAAKNDVTAANFPCNINGVITPFVLTASYKLAAQPAIFDGTTIQLDLITGSAPGISDWWDVGNLIPDANNCRGGAFNVLASDAGGSCTSPYGANQQGGGAFTQGILGAGSLRFENDRVSVNGNPYPMAGTAGYIAQRVQVEVFKTVFDEVSEVDGCTGCTQPACIVLNRIDVGADGVKQVLTTVDLRNYVTWYGGTGATCPGATPTRNATWGQVKALYR